MAIRIGGVAIARLFGRARNDCDAAADRLHCRDQARAPLRMGSGIEWSHSRILARLRAQLAVEGREPLRRADIFPATVEAFTGHRATRHRLAQERRKPRI